MGCMNLTVRRSAIVVNRYNLTKQYRNIIEITDDSDSVVMSLSVDIKSDDSYSETERRMVAAAGLKSMADTFGLIESAKNSVDDKSTHETECDCNEVAQ